MSVHFPKIRDKGKDAQDTFFMGYPVVICSEPKTDQPFIEVRYLYGVYREDHTPFYFITLEQSPEDYHFCITTYDGVNKINYGAFPTLSNDKNGFLDAAKKMVFKFVNQSLTKY